MQSTDLEEIKAALWEQAYHPCTQVRWGMAQVMTVKRSKGQLLVQLRGRGRWYPAEAVTGDQAEAMSNRRLRHRGRRIGARDPLPGGVRSRMVLPQTLG
jgi:hypothetical protein